jgi:hypothetical protein
MFIEVDRGKAIVNRFPILILDTTAQAAFAAGDLSRRARFRVASAGIELRSDERDAALAAGGVVLIASATSPFLGLWLRDLADLPVRKFPIVICPGKKADPSLRHAVNQRLRRLAARSGPLLPVFTEEIEARIDCETRGELRVAAQGFAIGAVVDALEHLASPVRLGDADRLEWDGATRGGFAAAMTLLPRAGASVDEQAQHLTERFFWPRRVLDGAREVVARIEMPRGTTERTWFAWRRAVERRFERSAVRFAWSEADADAPVRVSLYLPDLPLPADVEDGARTSLTPPRVAARAVSEPETARAAGSGF